MYLLIFPTYIWETYVLFSKSQQKWFFLVVFKVESVVECELSETRSLIKLT